MMEFTRDIAHGFCIQVEGEDTAKHSVDNWKCAILNTDYIGAPELETAYIDVPYRNGRIDISEVVSNRPIYKKRKIKIQLKGFRERLAWDTEITDIRNHFNGRICRITFDNDTAYFWRGRVNITEFSRERECGKFTVEMDAEPYKYNVVANAEPWRWDTFNFITGIAQDDGDIEVDGTHTEVIPSGFMLVAPKFICQNVNNLSVTDGRYTLQLKDGTNYDPRILVNGSNEVTLIFTGSGNVLIDYRGGSL